MEQHGYRRIREIGKGAFGQAVLCSNADGKRFVAKQLDLTTMSRAERESSVNEVRLLRKLNHPNIVRYVDHFSTSQTLYIIMEYADSGDLGSMLQARRSQLKEEEALHYLVQICLALKHLHDANILHRDLKAQNIFLAHKGRMVKLGDFGISTVLKSAGALAKTQCGTPFYFSPEMCQGLPYNAKSDMWSLGVLLYEMCTLRKPFQAANYKGLMTAICAGNPRPISESYSEELRKLLSTLMHKDPACRPSASDVLRMDFVRRKMEQIVGDSIKVSRPVTPPTADTPPTGPPPPLPTNNVPGVAPRHQIPQRGYPGVVPQQQHVRGAPHARPAAPQMPPQHQAKPSAHHQPSRGVGVPPAPQHVPQQQQAKPVPAAPVQKPEVVPQSQPQSQPQQKHVQKPKPEVAPQPQQPVVHKVKQPEVKPVQVNLHVSPYPRPPCMRLPSDQSRATPPTTADSCLPPSLLQGGAARPTGLPPAPVPTAITEAVRRRMANMEGPSSIPSSFAPINPPVVRIPSSGNLNNIQTTSKASPPPPPPPLAVVPPSIPNAVPTTGAPITPTIPPSRLPPAPFSVPTTVPRHTPTIPPQMPTTAVAPPVVPPVVPSVVAPVVVPPTTIVVTAPPRAALPVARPVVTAESIVNSLPSGVTSDSPKKGFLGPMVPKPEGAQAGLQGVPLILLSPMTANRVLQDAEQFTEAALDRLEAFGQSASEEEIQKEEAKQVEVEEQSTVEKAAEVKDDVDDEIADAVQSLSSESSRASTSSSSVEEEEPETPTEVVETFTTNDMKEETEASAEPLVTVATEEVEYGDMLHEICVELGVDGADGDVSTTWVPAESCTQCDMHRGVCDEHTNEVSEVQTNVVEPIVETNVVETTEEVKTEVVEVPEEVIEIQSDSVTEEESSDFMTISQLAMATELVAEVAAVTAEAELLAEALINAENTTETQEKTEETVEETGNEFENKSVLDDEVDALNASLSPSQRSSNGGNESPSAYSEADSSLNVSMMSDAGAIAQRRNPAGMLVWAAAAMAAPMALWYQVATLTA